MNVFQNIINNHEIILTEGALAERLKKEYKLKMDDSINHAGIIYEAPAVIENIYRQYLDIAEKYDLPVMIMTPTRRVNTDSLRNSKFYKKEIISDSCRFLNQIKYSYSKYSTKILTGGLLGCIGDAYSGKQIMNIEEAYAFHKQQTKQFQFQDINFLFAGIMPEINEAVGLAKAAAETGFPYIISFMIRKDGCLLDGTFIAEAIQMIDEQAGPKPSFYMTNCIHPTNLIRALMAGENLEHPSIKRLIGIQANTSTLSPEELNNSGIVHQDDFDNIINEMLVLRKDFNFKIFGGCCGTNEKFIEMMSEKLKSNIHIN